MIKLLVANGQPRTEKC